MARRSPGEGQVFFSKAKGVWIFRAQVGVRPDGSFRYREGRGKTRGEAAAKLKAAERAQAPGVSPKVADYLTRWLEDVAKPHVRHATWRRYESCVRVHIVPRVGGVRLAALTPGHVSQLYAELHRAGVSPGTIRKVSEVFASALEHAAREGILANPPTRAAVKPRVDRPPVEVFTDEEVDRLLTAAKPHRLYALFAVAIGTGMRQGELLALDWSDLSPDATTLHVRRTLTDAPGNKATMGPPKSRQGVRTVSLPGFAREALIAHRGHGEGLGLIFPNTDGTGPILRSNFRHEVWAKLLKRARVSPRRFHVLRHTAASRMLALGGDVPEVARILGDRAETVMRVYAHFLPGRGQEAADKMHGVYNPERGEKVSQTKA